MDTLLSPLSLPLPVFRTEVCLNTWQGLGEWLYFMILTGFDGTVNQSVSLISLRVPIEELQASNDVT
jgi:hypothetical protein